MSGSKNFKNNKIGKENTGDKEAPRRNRILHNLVEELIFKAQK